MVFIQIATSNKFFLLFYPTDQRSYCQGSEAPSDQLAIVRPARSAKQGPRFQLNSLALFYHLQRERAAPAPSSARTRPLAVRRTMDSRAGGGGGVIVTDDVRNIRRLMLPDTEQRVTGSRERADSKMVKSDTGLWGRGGCRMWMESVFCVSVPGTAERNTLSE